MSDDALDGTISWRELLSDTTMILGDATHARWICETATGSSPDEFRGMLDAPATERSVHHLDAMVARARTGEPIQYVLGAWGFRHLDLVVDRRVLIPRPETELLVDLARERAADIAGRRTIVDLGTGSGAIGLALASELPLAGTTVVLTDESSEALDVARANLAGLGRAASNVTITRGDWFDALHPGLIADVIVTNPPYVAAGSPDLDDVVARWEPASALMAGPDGLDAIRRIVGGARGHLTEGGWLLIEHGHDQGAAVRGLFEDAGFESVETHRDLAGRERVTSGRT